MIKRLPRRVRHKESETSLSLALRLAHRHGEGWYSFTSSSGLPESALRLSLSADRLASLSGVEVERLRKWTPEWLGHNMKVMGHTFDRSRFLRLNLRICPQCMREDMAARADGEREEDAAYLRLEWSLAFIYGCERHAQKLVTRCPACGERPHWRVGRIDECHCGASLLVSDSQSLSTKEVRLLRALLDRLRGVEPGDDILAPLNGVPLADVVNLLRVMGQLASGEKEPVGAACALEVDNLSSLLLGGVEVLSDLPHSFTRLLDGLFDGTGQSRSAKEAYGLPLLRWMRSNRPFVEKLVPIFWQHCALRGIRIDKVSRPAPNCHLSGEEREEILTPHEMERLVRAAGWTGSLPARRGEVIASLLGGSELLATMEAVAWSGLGRQTFHLVCAATNMQPAWRKQSGHLYFYRSELEALRTRLAGNAPVVSERKAGLVPLTQLHKGKFRTSAEIIAAALAGEFNCSGFLPAVSGFSGLLFRPEQVPAARPRPADTLTSAEICNVIWCSIDDVPAIRAAGLLDLIPCDSAKASTARSVAEFDAKFVTGRALAKEHTTNRCRLTPKGRSFLQGRTSVMLARLLASEGVHSVVTGAKVYRRADVDLALAKLPNLRRRRKGSTFHAE